MQLFFLYNTAQIIFCQHPIDGVYLALTKYFRIIRILIQKKSIIITKFFIGGNIMDDLLYIVVTAFVSVAVLFILSKLIGNKQMSNLNMFDYVNGITIGSIAAEMATSEISDFWQCFVALLVYALIMILLTILSQKSAVCRRFFTGKSIVLYDRGKLFKRNLTTAKIDFNEFLTMLRDKEYFSLDDVETVMFEHTGQISVLPKDKSRPVSPDDLKIVTQQKRIEVVVVADGRVLKKNLNSTGNNMDWLNSELEKQNEKIETVFAAFCDGDNNLKILKCSDRNPTNNPFC